MGESKILKRKNTMLVSRSQLAGKLTGFMFSHGEIEDAALGFNLVTPKCSKCGKGNVKWFSEHPENCPECGGQIRYKVWAKKVKVTKVDKWHLYYEFQWKTNYFNQMRMKFIEGNETQSRSCRLDHVFYFAYQDTEMHVIDCFESNQQKDG